MEIKAVGTEDIGGMIKSGELRHETLKNESNISEALRCKQG